MTERLRRAEGPSQLYIGRPAPIYVRAFVERDKDRSFTGLPDPVAVLRYLYERHSSLPESERKEKAFQELAEETKRYKATGEVILDTTTVIDVELGADAG